MIILWILISLEDLPFGLRFKLQSSLNCFLWYLLHVRSKLLDPFIEEIFPAFLWGATIARFLKAVVFLYVLFSMRGVVRIEMIVVWVFLICWVDIMLIISIACLPVIFIFNLIWTRRRCYMDAHSSIILCFVILIKQRKFLLFKRKTLWRNTVLQIIALRCLPLLLL